MATIAMMSGVICRPAQYGGMKCLANTAPEVEPQSATGITARSSAGGNRARETLIKSVSRPRQGWRGIFDGAKPLKMERSGSRASRTAS